MEFLDLTLPTPEENLALDEALLDEADRDALGETLRLWEPRRRMVIVGRSSAIEVETHVEACCQQNVPVLRRASGGAAILAGPGCLMYALVLGRRHRPLLRGIDRTHRFVLDTLAAALRRHVPEVRCEGTSDLTISGRKFSGNSMRCKREYVLYHGTLLYDFPLDEVGWFLKTPPRQPSYRAERDHEAFLANLPLPIETLRQTLRDAWNATQRRGAWPQAETARLAADKYSQTLWS